MPEWMKWSIDGAAMLTFVLLLCSKRSRRFLNRQAHKSTAHPDELNDVEGMKQADESW
jgi:hypothetical protein